jgi:hypothetical protein
LNSGPSPWATPPALFLWRIFWDRVSWTICLGWFRTAILLVSASWVARIIGVSHWCQQEKTFIVVVYYVYGVGSSPKLAHAKSEWLWSCVSYFPWAEESAAPFLWHLKFFLKYMIKAKSSI